MPFQLLKTNHDDSDTFLFSLFIQLFIYWDFGSPYVFSGLFYEFVNKNKQRYNFETVEGKNLKFTS